MARRTDEQLLSETKRVQAEIDLAKARQELDGFQRAWWRDAKSISTLTAVIAGLVPAITFVQGWIDTRFTQQQAAIKEAEALKSAYLDRLKSPGQRLRTLRFIEMNSEGSMQAWAKRELALVGPELRRSEEELAYRRDLLAELADIAIANDDLKLAAEIRQEQVAAAKLDLDMVNMTDSVSSLADD